MNQPSKETAKLLLQLIKPIAKKRMLEDRTIKGVDSNGLTTSGNHSN